MIFADTVVCYSLRICERQRREIVKVTCTHSRFRLHSTALKTKLLNSSNSFCVCVCTHFMLSTSRLATPMTYFFVSNTIRERKNRVWYLETNWIWTTDTGCNILLCRNFRWKIHIPFPWHSSVCCWWTGLYV